VSAGPNENRQLGTLAARIAGPAGVGGLILLIVAVLIAWLGDAGWERFLRAYLVAYCFVLSLSLGGLFFTMLHHLTRAGWSVVLRRIAEGLAGNLRWIWILFIPIVIGLFTTELYPWAHAADDPLLDHKEPFLNTTFWLVRAVFYFVVWAGLAHLFVGHSVAQDASGDPRLTLRMQRIDHRLGDDAGAALVQHDVRRLFLRRELLRLRRDDGHPLLHHSMYGTRDRIDHDGALPGSRQVPLRLRRRVLGLHRLQPVHADLVRQHPRGDGMVRGPATGRMEGLEHPAGHRSLRWAVPDPDLASPFIDIYWLAMPAVPVELIASVSTYAELVAEFESTYAETYDLHWSMVDPLCALGLLGLAVAGTAAGLRGVSLIPEGDPRLSESLAFENY
jgi:hypothetical protein